MFHHTVAVRPSPVFKISQNNNSKAKKVIATCGMVGLAQGIINDIFVLTETERIGMGITEYASEARVDETGRGVSHL